MGLGLDRSLGRCRSLEGDIILGGCKSLGGDSSTRSAKGMNMARGRVGEGSGRVKEPGRVQASGMGHESGSVRGNLYMDLGGDMSMGWRKGLQ